MNPTEGSVSDRAWRMAVMLLVHRPRKLGGGDVQLKHGIEVGMSEWVVHGLSPNVRTVAMTRGC